MNEWKKKYIKLNNSFGKVMVYRVGIDAGFFTEYAKMIRAMLYCLQHQIKFKLYSRNANFSFLKGWTDYFIPFTEEVNDDFHQIYNRHRTPSWWTLLKECLKKKDFSLITWKLKVFLYGIIGHYKSWNKYGKWTLMNQDISFNPNEHYYIPELGINGNYRQAFSRMIDITWELNNETIEQVEELRKELNLPPKYLGIQARGGDKITEVDLINIERYRDIIENRPEKDIFLLTDDYNIYKNIVAVCPEKKIYTLCTEKEKGYVNSKFTHTEKQEKEIQMKRFLTSIQFLMNAYHFIGTITTGPCMFLFKYMYPNVTLMDYDKDYLDEIVGTSIETRVMQVQSYLKK